MSTATSGLMLRHTRFVTRRTALRHASTTAEASQAASNTAAKSKEAASNATSKASQGLSRVTSSAESAVSGAAEGVSNVAGRVTGRVGRLISFVQSIYPPTVYYSKVGLELAKLVFKGRQMSPPSLATFQSYSQPILNAVRHPRGLFSHTTNSGSSLSPESILNRMRNLNRQQLASAGVVTAEVLGFFTVGEMLGRLKVVGYRSDQEHHETATPHH